MASVPVTSVATAKPPGQSLRDFAESVATMRRLQASYFRSRDPKLLASAKKLEQQVDATCTRILQTSPRQQETRALFDE